MLKVIGRSDLPQASVEIDGCVPFILSLGVEPAQGESLIWSCREGDFSLCEIWLDPKGTIHRVSLVLLNISGRVLESSDEDTGPTVPTPGRIPVCDVSAWEDPEVVKNHDSLVVQGRFGLHLGKNFASLRFYEMGEPKEWIVNHRSRFGINSEERLCRVDLIALAPKDLSTMREALAYRPKQK